ncbi:hypothetical protein [Mesoterricola silvestris]|uniref:Phage minor structural protein GP20 n=1 Tax=Mesoterricola silvestris TaxID=2927979 RepID=A0AA48GQY7_9BACT|nr:hypothetical protein [Mesoterricola silvestris]BDU72392.1 hypothetical protein METEAL_15660 [Mesoterricola silvestris]
MTKIRLKSLDGLDAESAALFKKADDGMFEYEPEDVTGLKSALEKERTNSKKYEPLAKAWEKLGKTPEEISALLEREKDLEKKKEELELQDALKKGEYQKVLDGEAKKREQMAAAHKADLEAANGTAMRYKSALEKYLIEAQATAAITEAKGVPQLLMPHVLGRVKVLEQDGKFTVQILDPVGNPLVAGAGGEPATFKHLLDGFKADPIFGRAFEGTNASGGGAPHTKSNPGAKTMTRASFDQLTPTDRSAFMKDGGSLTD